MRLVPERPLPIVSYVPGRMSRRDVSPNLVTGIDSVSAAFRWGCDLFNHGFYWEAHEAWEFAWHRLGRRGRPADFVKALIKVAAGCVKHREGRPNGAAGHLRRASELLDEVDGADESRSAHSSPSMFGLDLGDARSLVDEVTKLTTNTSLDPADYDPTAVRPFHQTQLVPKSERSTWSCHVEEKLASDENQIS